MFGRKNKGEIFALKTLHAKSIETLESANEEEIRRIEKESSDTLSEKETYFLEKLNERSINVNELKQEIKELKAKIREQSRADIITSSIDIILDQIKPKEAKKSLRSLEGDREAAVARMQMYPHPQNSLMEMNYASDQRCAGDLFRFF